MEDNILNAALNYASVGLRVFPISIEKRPLVREWTKSATTDPEIICGWWAQFPKAQVAIATGKLSNCSKYLTVIDCDVKDGKNGVEEWQGVQYEFECTAPPTLSATSGGGGKHYYYLTDMPYKSTSSIFGAGSAVDVRCEGGCIIAPPSRSIKGVYAWDKPFAFAEIKDASIELSELLSESRAVAGAETVPFSPCECATSGGSSDVVDNITTKLRLDFGEGGRNESIHKLACSLQARGYSDNDIYNICSDINNKRCAPPLPDKEVQTCVSSALKAIQKGVKHTPAAELPPFAYTTVNMKGEVQTKINVSLLEEYIRENERIYFTAGEKPRIFLYDKKAGVYRLTDGGAMKALIKEYIAAVDKTIITRKMIDDTYALLTSQKEKLDETTLNTDEHYINFKNGLLRLSDMTLLPHTPDLLSTVQLPCDWTNTPAETPVFDSFLENLLPNEDERRLLVEFIGVALSNVRGSIAKSALFLYGVSNSGKSRLFMLLSRILGAENTASVQLQDLEKNFAVAPIINKRLIGSADARIENISEMATFKSLVSGDPVRVEEKYHSPTKGEYKGVMLFCCNRLPTFGGDKSSAVYDRCVILNCPNAVPAEKQDPYIVDKMYAERQGILYKAIYALKDFIARGCKYDLPQSVIQSRERYAEYNSPVRQFVNDCCIYVDPESPRPFYTSRQDIFNAFKRYCEDCNIDIRGITLQKFGEEVAAFCDTTREKNEIKINIGGRQVKIYKCLDLVPQKETNFERVV